MNNRKYFIYRGSSLLGALLLLLFWVGCGTHKRGLPPAPPSSAPVEGVEAEAPPAPEPSSFGENEAADDSAGPALAEEGATEAPYGAPNDRADHETGHAESQRSTPGRRAQPKSRGSVARRPPPDRPGLGTVWGEQRESSIRSTSFVRNSPSRPDAQLALHYNDRQGVAAMTQRRPYQPDEGTIAFAGDLASVRVLSAGYDALPSFFAHGRRYVIGEHGDRYTIEIRNHTGGRLEVVTTVDGLDVMDGRSGSIHKRGYIIAPHDVVLIEGFRTSEESVAAFRFGSVRDSYAAKKGQARNVGVIGVALFVEEAAYAPYQPWEVERRHRADPFPGRFAEPPGR